VEDDPAVVEFVQKAVERNGHTTEVATDGRQAYDRVYGADFEFDLILSDLHLPVMTGAAFLAEVYPLIESTTPVIVTSGVAYMIEALGEMRRGAFGVLEKPFNLGALGDLIERALAQREVYKQVADLKRKVENLTHKNNILLRRNSELFAQARMDALTGLPNRRRLHEDLHVIDANLRRYTAPFAIALVDVDDFGRFNKEHGLHVGDDVLRRVALTLRDACRQGDLVYRFEDSANEPAFRYGGDEFVLILAAQDQASAIAAMERIRERILVEQTSWEGVYQQDRVTISVGVISNDPEAQLTVEEMIHEANEYLRRAKRAGGNCVQPSSVVAESPGG
jgi:diguanylate cyclase (GGDEF)-like protein